MASQKFFPGIPVVPQKTLLIKMFAPALPDTQKLYKLNLIHKKISFKEILQVFFSVHDPTTLNQQGNDFGTQYRSAIFFHSDEQKQTAVTVISEIENLGIWDDPIVTEVTKFEKLYEAENYHQEYFANNPNQPYCVAVVAPKVAKFRKQFLDKLKK